MVDEDTRTMGIPGAYAGGGTVRSTATVILQMGDGREASIAMHRYLMGEDNRG